MHKLRAIATRCCWPPESWPGYLFACSGILTLRRNSIAVASASFLGVLRTQIGARVQFSRIVRCGNRLKCWNTIPTSERTLSMFLRSEVSSTPSTMILPFWCSSSRLMQRISVDLPEPGRAGDDDALALVDREVDVAQHVELAVPLVHADDLDREFVGDLEPVGIDMLELGSVDGMDFGHWVRPF